MTARTPPARAPHRRASASASNGRAAMTAEHETAPCDFCRGRDARRGFSITRAGAYRCGRCTAGAADAAALHALREIVLDLGFGFSSAAGVAEDARQIARANAAPISRVAPLLGRAIVLRGHTGEAGAMLAQRIRAARQRET